MTSKRKTVIFYELVHLLWKFMRVPSIERGEQIITEIVLDKILKRPLLFKDKLDLEYLLYPGQNAGAYIQNEGNYEVGETQFCLNFVKPGMIIFDVGANIGLYTMLYAKLAGVTGSVHAFEPESNNFRKLRVNLLLNSFDNVVVNNCAVFSVTQMVKLNTFPDSVNSWHTLGTLELPDPWNPGKKISPTGFQNVEGISLDDYCLHKKIEYIDFLKVDVEGAELDVLLGAKQLFKSEKIGTVMFEISLPQIEGMGHNSNEIFQFFIENNYQLFKINQDGSLDPLGNLQPENYQNVIAISSQTMRKQEN